MTVPARVGLATLGVSDVVRATEFYESLGWRLSPASVPGVVSYFHTGGGLLSLLAAEDLAADPAFPAFTGARGVMLTIPVGSDAEVDDALRTAVQAGAALAQAGKRAGHGGYLGYFTDPDGHLWQVTHHPAWPLDPSGVPRLP